MASISLNVAQNQENTYKTVEKALVENDAQIKYKNPPSDIEYVMQEKDNILSGLKIKFHGKTRVNILQNGETNVYVEVAPDSASLFVFIAISLLALWVIGGFFRAGFFLLVGLGVIVWGFYSIWQSVPDKMINRIKNSIINNEKNYMT